MKPRKTSPVVLVFFGLALLGCIGGAGLGMSAIHQEIAHRRSEKQAQYDMKMRAEQLLHQEKQAQEDMMANIRQLVNSGKLGERPNFPDTVAGRIHSHMYDYIVANVARREILDKSLATIGWDQVLAADSIKSKASLEKSLHNAAAVRKAVVEFYEAIDRDTIKLQESLKREAGSDREAQNFVTGIDFIGPTSRLASSKEAHESIKKNLTAIEGMLNCLLRRVGKYIVAPDGAVTFSSSTRDADVQQYNAFVAQQREAVDELNRLERLRKSRLNSALEIL